MPTPVPPGGIPTIAGTWSGLIQFTFQNDPNKCLQTRLELAQTNRTVQGTWIVTAPAGNDIRGEISGTLTDDTVVATFSGTATWNSPQTGTSARCVGRALLVGSAIPSRLRWSTPGFTFDNCGDAGMTDLVWTLDPGPTTSRCTQ